MAVTLDTALAGRVIGWKPLVVRACVATDDEVVTQTIATTMPARPIALLLKSAEVYRLEAGVKPEVVVESFLTRQT